MCAAAGVGDVTVGGDSGRIAATALMNDLTVVTRNVADFVGTGAKVLDPFG